MCNKLYHFCLPRIGRRTTLVGFLGLAGVACMGVPFMPPSLLLPTSLVGKLAISASFCVIYVHRLVFFYKGIIDDNLVYVYFFIQVI